MLKTFKNLEDMRKAFPDENACIDHFRAVRWPDADRITCPHCGTINRHYVLADNTHKCRDCRRKFTVRNGTIFEDSKIELRKWFTAIFLATSHKKGISSCQLARDIGVTQKTAWFMLHRVRNAAIFHAGRDRLIKPVVAVAAAQSTPTDTTPTTTDDFEPDPVQDRHRDRRGGGGGNGSGDGTGGVHSAIAGLLRELPAPGTAWDLDEKQNFLDAMKAVLDFIYPKPKTAKG